MDGTEKDLPRADPNGRDRALLRAVASGQCEVTDDCGPVLSIEGRCCCDQLAARRLISAGLLHPPADRRPRPARLTPTGHLLIGV